MPKSIDFENMNDDKINYENCIKLLDQLVQDYRHRAREHQQQALKILQRKQHDEFPFHDPKNVIDACTTGLRVVTGISSDIEITEHSNPRQVYQYIVQTISEYGEACRKEGEDYAREDCRPRIPKQHFMEAYKLFKNLNKLIVSPHEPLT